MGGIHTFPHAQPDLSYNPSLLCTNGTILLLLLDTPSFPRQSVVATPLNLLSLCKLAAHPRAGGPPA